MVLARGDHLGPYEILGLLGAGGMGEVYRAHDPRLGREVAIKVLPDDVARDPARLRRFEKEARATGALSHPNILDVHDIGAHDGRPYLVAELLEGETLRQRMGGKALPAAEAVELAVQIARGLAAAHDKGIVHRDLKPENLFVTRAGVIKVLDFGLAKLRSPQRPMDVSEDDLETASRTTLPGAVMGTVGYMSPEQVRGRDADHRADIFSFGAVLYELLAGRRAFRGDSGVEILNAILKETPESIGTGRHDLPQPLVTVLEKCLEKRAEDRFQSAHDLALALELAMAGQGSFPRTTLWRSRAKGRTRRVAVGAILLLTTLAGAAFWASRRHPLVTPATDRDDPALSARSADGGDQALESNRVAVAVFENRTGDPTLDSLGLMAADWITDDLSGIHSIDVAMSPSSALGVGAAVDSAALATHRDPRAVGIRARAGIVVSGEYSLQGGDLVCRARLTDPTSGRLLLAIEPVAGASERPTEVVEATKKAAISAVAFHLDTDFDVGVQRPPSLRAYQEYAESAALWYLDWSRVIEHLERAVALDPRFVHAQVALAMAHFLRGDHEKAEQRLAVLDGLDGLSPFERLNRRYTRAVLGGRNSECLALMREMEQLAPGVSWLPFDRGVWAMALNRPTEAERAFARAGRQQHGGGWVLPDLHAQSLHSLGRFEDQYRVASQGLEAHPTIMYLHEQQAAALAALGRFDDLERVVSAALRAQPSSGTAGLVMLVAAMELRAHGHAQHASALASRAIDWYVDASANSFLSLQTPNRGFKWYRTWADDIPGRLRLEHATALYWAGRWPEAEAVVESLAEENPGNVEYLGWLGTLAARMGRRDEAARVASALETADRRYLFGLDAFWRSAIAAQLGEREQAIELLNEAFARGHYFQLHLHRNIDFEPLWDDPSFLELLRPKG